MNSLAIPVIAGPMEAGRAPGMRYPDGVLPLVQTAAAAVAVAFLSFRRVSSAVFRFCEPVDAPRAIGILLILSGIVALKPAAG